MMKRIFNLMAILLVFCNVPMSAQLSIKEVLNFYAVYPLPYPQSGQKKVRYSIDNSQGMIPNRLYKNIQCTDYFFAENKGPLGASAYAKFQLPQQKGSLLAIRFGGRTDRQTEVLVSVNSDGNILDTLEVAVGWVYIKQYRILIDGQIVVTTIKPKQEESIPFGNFAPFVGNRIDCTYIVEEGKFVLKKEQKYADKTYTNELLSGYKYRLWNGDEQLLN